MKRMKFVVLLCLVFLLSVSYSFATSNKSKFEVTEKEQKLVEEIINSDKNVIREGKLL